MLQNLGTIPSIGKQRERERERERDRERGEIYLEPSARQYLNAGGAC
jgi:hypothetical protein